MNNLIKSLAIAGTLATLLGTAGAAQAVTIDFDSLNDPTSDFGFVGTNYSEDGFNLDAGRAFFVSVNAVAPTYNGSASLLNNGLNSATTLVKDDGGLFKLESIDLDWLNGNIDFDGDGFRIPVTFTGTRSDNSTVSRTFRLDAAQGLQTFNFGGGFNKLKSVSWQQEPDFHQFDNIDIAEVPEPLTILGSLAALGMGVTLKREYSRRQA